MNILENAKKGIIIPEFEYIADIEEVDVEYICAMVSKGEIVIFKNNKRNINPVAVGKGLRTKINANIGSSPDMFDIDIEIEKLHVAVESGADAVMDLSIGGNISTFRKRIIEESVVPLGTVPIYEVAVEMANSQKSIMDMTIKDYLNVIKKQAEDGVDFMTIHSGVTKESLESLHSQDRIIGITSRGGSMLAEWIYRNGKENPLYEYYDDILDILKEYDVVISLGDGLRPGCLHDASDSGQIHEMILLGALARRAKEKDVQAIIEGPGHVPIDIIADNMRLEKSLCDNAPYYVL
ncbi:MAG: phosphomethylpyrimidine synthase ThiC, partial [Spirochaetota bacterium]|nr:phosphomethylpyrimidine synthase ThiC [Spirochaetota bacterium]